MDNYEKAVKAAKELSGYEGSNHKIINHHSEYLNGSLFVVGFDGNDGRSKTNYVYIEGSDVTVCKNDSLLNELVSRKSKKNLTSSIIDSLEGVAGVIGLIITLTIVWLLINNPKAEIPQTLSAALTTILGFYFGSRSK